MSDGIKLSETPEVPQESREVTEARQQIEQVTFEPEAAVERSADIKTAEAVEAAVKEVVEAVAAGAATEDRRPETGNREGTAGTATGDGVEAAVSAADGGPGTEDRVENPAATRDGSQAYELRSDSQTGAQAVVERIESVESARVSPPESAEAELQPERAESVQILEGEAAASPGEAERAEVHRGDDSQQKAGPSLEEEKPGEDNTAAGSKAVGDDSSTGIELSMDPESKEDSSIEPGLPPGETDFKPQEGQGLQQRNSTAERGAFSSNLTASQNVSQGVEGTETGAGMSVESDPELQVQDPDVSQLDSERKTALESASKENPDEIAPQLKQVVTYQAPPEGSDSAAESEVQIILSASGIIDFNEISLISSAYRPNPSVSGGKTPTDVFRPEEQEASHERGLPETSPSGPETSAEQTADQKIKDLVDYFARLVLQKNTQQENRQFTLMSNVMKVKHDQAKSAIDNVR